MNGGKQAAGALVLASLLVLSACGDSAREASGDAAQAVTVAVANASKPNSYTDTEGKLTGYEVDILRAIDDIIPEYKLNIEAVSQSAQEIGIDTGKYALIAQGFFKTADREAKYLIPEEHTGVSLMKIFTLQEQTDVHTLADLQGKKLAPVPPNGGIYNLLVNYNEQNPNAAVSFSTAENVPIANRFKELLDKKYDAVIWPSANLDLGEIENSLGAQFRASEPVQINPTYFLIAKEQTDFYEKVNQAIRQLKENGTLPEISETYFGENVFEFLK